MDSLPHADAWRRRSPRPRALHLVLALATFGTLALAGGVFWEPVDPAVPSLRAWLDPATVVRVLAAGWVYGLWVMLILGAHEMGHYLACRWYGIPATLPFFLPGVPPLGSFGAVIRIRGVIPHRRALFDVAAAGPIAGFLVSVPVLAFGLARAEPFVAPPGLDAEGALHLGQPVLLMLLEPLVNESGTLAANAWIGAGWVGLLVTSLNLFPVGQLDGGHAAYAVSRSLHRLLSRLTLVGLLGVVIAQIVVFRQFPLYLLWFAILLTMRDRHPRLLDETMPLGTGRRWIALLLVAIFAVSFILLPVYVD